MANIPDWVWFIGFFAAYFFLMRWVFPRMGVAT